jgi:hypothetical protein
MKAISWVRRGASTVLVQAGAEREDGEKKGEERQRTKGKRVIKMVINKVSSKSGGVKMTIFVHYPNPTPSPSFLFRSLPSLH